MGISRKCLAINMGIIFFNTIFGVIIHITMTTRSPIRERYVQLPAESLINDPQLADEFQMTESPLMGNDTFWGGIGGGGIAGGGNCQNYTEHRSPNLDPSRGMLDRSRKFRLHDFSVIGDKWSNVSNSWNICLATQTSTDLMFWIDNQIEMWKGPMSVSLFTPDVDYTIAVKMIKYLQTCFPEVRARVVFHMIYPVKLPPIMLQTEDDQLEYDCDQPEAVNTALVKQIRTEGLSKFIKTNPYPQNLLRNFARQGCPNEYIFTPDIDMISIPGMSNELNTFTLHNSTRACNKCAFIIPTYEIHSSIKTNPVNKNDLKSLIKRRRAQIFHIRAFSPNQANSKLKRWEKSTGSNSLGILYNITTWKNYWEPIYIAKASVPYYDERFLGYGFTRNSQVYEMHVDDYSWFMLNKPFLCHRGFQLSKRRNAIRRSQITVNSNKYKQFRKELYVRYGKKEEDYEAKTSKGKKKPQKQEPTSLAKEPSDNTATSDKSSIKEDPLKQSVDPVESVAKKEVKKWKSRKRRFRPKNKTS